MPIKLKKQSGQVMLLTVLVMAAVFLSATVIAGLLTVYQLSQVTRITDSARAIYAADSAIERGLFIIFRCNGMPRADYLPAGVTDINTFCNQIKIADTGQGGSNLPLFLNEAAYRLGIQPNVFTTNPQDSGIKIQANGRAGKSARAFEIQF